MTLSVDELVARMMAGQISMATAVSGLRQLVADARRAGQEEMRTRAAEVARTHGLEHPGDCNGGPACWYSIAYDITALPLSQPAGLEPERAAQDGANTP